MLSRRELVRSLFGAWMLARLDLRGYALFDTSLGGVWRSFLAAVLVAPLYALMLWTGIGDDPDLDLGRFALVETIAYVMSWVAYPLIVEFISRQLGCRANFERYLVAYNWSMVLQNVAIAPIGILVAIGALPPTVGQLAWLILFTLILAYVWFIVRTSLEVPPLTATGLVIADVLVSVVIDRIAAGMY